MGTSKRKKTIQSAKNGYQASKSFILGNYKTIIKAGVALFLLYWVIFILTPSVKMSADMKEKIDTLNSHIDSLESNQKKLDADILSLNQDVIKTDKIISGIKQEKTIIKEIYHEKIINVDNYTSHELDSFFAERYGYTN